jgi:hypothetical protein
MKMSLRTAFVAAATSAVALAASGSAMAAAPTGEFAPFKYCPYQNTAVANCLVSTSTSGSFKLGTSTVPVSAPIVFQGGFTINDDASTTFYNAANGGTVLSRTPLNVPGGLLGLVNPGGFFGLLEQAFENAIRTANGVTATAELAGTPRFDFFSFVAQSGTAVTLPIRVHLENPFLGPNCYIGSSSRPITLRLTTGTTTPPAGVTPLTGTVGTPGSTDDGLVATTTGTKLVDNTFTVPAASDCGYLPLDKLLITAAVNSREGLPSAAGVSSAVLQGGTQIADTPSVAASVS